MTEFLKGYAAGANDMEAGRLETEVEKWRQYQHKAANEAWKWKARAEAAEAKLDAHAIEISQHKGDLRRAEAKLAEVERGLDAALEQVEDERARVMGVEKERDAARTSVTKQVEIKRRLSEKYAAQRASMDRARELARVLRADMADCDFDGFVHPEDARNEWAERLDGLARLFSRDE